jgi:hypothetical protein
VNENESAPNQSEILAALEVHHLQSSTKHKVAVARLIDRWQFHWSFCAQWQVAVGGAWNDKTMLGQRVCVACFWLGCFVLALSWSKSVRYDPGDFARKSVAIPGGAI